MLISAENEVLIYMTLDSASVVVLRTHKTGPCFLITTVTPQAQHKLNPVLVVFMVGIVFVWAQSNIHAHCSLWTQMHKVWSVLLLIVWHNDYPNLLYIPKFIIDILLKISKNGMSSLLRPMTQMYQWKFLLFPITWHMQNIRNEHQFLSCHHYLVTYQHIMIFTVTECII